MINKSSGFTLIEISIVLVIVGLLAGGILKGQQMIENAKYQAMKKEIDGIRVAFNTFQERYRYYPGDFRYASNKLSTSTITATNGNGNGLISGGLCTANGEESCLVWQHLILAGLLTGDGSQIGIDSGLTCSAGGRYSAILTLSRGPGSSSGSVQAGVWVMLYISGLPGAFAERLDRELDNDDGRGGIVMQYNDTATAATQNYDHSKNYSMFIKL